MLSPQVCIAIDAALGLPGYKATGGTAAVPTLFFFAPWCNCKAAGCAAAMCGRKTAGRGAAVCGFVAPWHAAPLRVCAADYGFGAALQTFQQARRRFLGIRAVFFAEWLGAAASACLCMMI